MLLASPSLSLLHRSLLRINAIEFEELSEEVRGIEDEDEEERSIQSAGEPEPFPIQEQEESEAVLAEGTPDQGMAREGE